MTLIEHLEELRSRLFKVAIAFVVAVVICGVFVRRIFELLVEPGGEALGGELNFIGPAQGILTDMKLILFSAFLLTIPFIIYQAWMFVAPAVGEVGRAFTYFIVILSSLLFLAGIAFGYFVVLPVSLQFLLGYAEDRYNELITADSYLPFVTRFLLAFGIIFELPSAAYVGAKLGLITAPMLRRFRRHAIVASVVLAAVVTPTPDPFIMMLMAAPITVMYEVSIQIARFVNPVLPHEEAMEASPLSDLTPDDDEEDGYEDDDEPDEDRPRERDL